MNSSTLQNEGTNKNARLRSLYVCYYPLSEPLVQTQVVAYLQGLAQRGHTIHLLTYETQRLCAAQKRLERKRLKAQGITWHHLTYHKRPTLPATLFDSALGIWTACRIVRRYRLECIHARSHVPAAMGVMIKKLTGAKLIFDIRGLLAEEYEDAGSWARDGLPFRLTKAAQNKAVAQADGIVVLTQRVKRVLFERGYQTQNEPERRIGPSPVLPREDVPVQVIPCCADLGKIEAQSDQREAMRRELGLENKTVLVYVGKFGGWYLQREMIEFFAVARRLVPDLHFLILTQSDHALAQSEFETLGVPASTYTLTGAPHHRVGAYLAASDVAISFIAAMPSKIASSPTKIGEYLAAGLPVLSNPGVGDVDNDLLGHRVGIVVPFFEEAAYQDAVRQWLELRDDADLPARCRRAAHATTSLQEIGVPRYDALYQIVASQT